MRLAVLFLFGLPLLGGEFVVLSNGFRIHADAHQQSGDSVTLQANGGVITVQAAEIARFEPEEAVPAAAPAPASSQPVVPAPDPKKLARMAADATAIPPALVQSVARAESAWHTDALSPKGAIGLMQLMPDTAARLKADPHDPVQNAWAGALYLRQLLVRYHGSVSRAVAAYNAGPGAVDKYGGIPPYAETRDYVRRVLADYEKATRGASGARQ